MDFLKGLKERWEKISVRQIDNFLCKRIILKNDRKHTIGN